MNPLEILGIFSALLALSAFIGNEYHKLENDSVWYDLLNFIAGTGLVIYALSINAIPFVLTNSVWAVVSLIDLVKYAGKRMRD